MYFPLTDILCFTTKQIIGVGGDLDKGVLPRPGEGKGAREMRGNDIRQGRQEGCVCVLQREQHRREREGPREREKRQKKEGRVREQLRGIRTIVTFSLYNAGLEIL